MNHLSKLEVKRDEANILYEKKTLRKEGGSPKNLAKDERKHM